MINTVFIGYTAMVVIHLFHLLWKENRWLKKRNEMMETYIKHLEETYITKK
jgi:hypothetical protein